VHLPLYVSLRLVAHSTVHGYILSHYYNSNAQLLCIACNCSM
jgi:hypothetical protein